MSFDVFCVMYMKKKIVWSKESRITHFGLPNQDVRLILIEPSLNRENQPH